MLMGYPHLLASLRFLLHRKPSQRRRDFFVLTGFTIVAAIVHLSSIEVPKLGQLPFGMWQMIIATIAVIAVGKLISKTTLWALALLSGFLVATWYWPLISVGAMLLLHNWVAFFTWIRRAPPGPRRWWALAATGVFFWFHAVVLFGLCDGFMPREGSALMFPGQSQTTAWLLASWSEDQLIWYRFLVLYTFGLSLHYFVWLRAIPEGQQCREAPASFRRIINNLTSDLGAATVAGAFLVIVAGMGVWLISRPLGARIYFEAALLHGCLELMFLLLPARPELELEVTQQK